MLPAAVGKCGFAGSMAGTWQAKITATASLTGGTSPSVAITTISAGGDTGQAFAVTDPLGLVSRTYSDALGRTTQTVEDFTDGEITDETNKTTGYTYNSAGMTSLTAYETGGGGETTAYVYGVTTGTGNAVDDNDIVAATEWPDPTTARPATPRKNVTTVDALGETITSTDRNGTTHTLSYDVLGRVVSDAVTTLGDGLDDSVLRIDTAYDGQGNAYLITSYDAASGGDIVNQVEDIYNGLGQMIGEWQAVGGSVNISTSPEVQYAYDEMPSGDDESRLASVTYASGYVLTYNYSSGINNDISRLSSLSDTTGTLESYSYLGLGTVVIRAMPQPGIELTYVKQGEESNGDAGDKYTGLDRFGRVVDQRWIDTGTGDATERFEYTYDRDGNVLTEDNLVDSDFDQTFAYDELNQLSTYTQGTGHAQDFSYDSLGNMTDVDTDDTDQTRTANDQNEITSVSGATTPTYDAAGNMTGDQNGLTFVYDAWNRLVAVKDGATVLETFSYDGRNFRVTNTVDDVTTDLYYSTQHQVLEEQISGEDVDRYVWSPVYVNAMVLRERATTTPGTLDERLWEQQDANWDVTALVNGSGVVVERYTYDPFGAVTVYDGSYVMQDGGSNYASVYLYQGMRLDPISGLDAADERWYSPIIGTWTSTDPLRFATMDSNLYRFVNNNPIKATDPNGLDSSTEHLILLIAEAITVGDFSSAEAQIRALRFPLTSREYDYLSSLTWVRIQSKSHNRLSAAQSRYLADLAERRLNIDDLFDTADPSAASILGSAALAGRKGCPDCKTISKQLATLIPTLGNEDFEIRESASDAISDMLKSSRMLRDLKAYYCALDALQETLGKTPNPEIAARIRAILRRLDLHRIP